MDKFWQLVQDSVIVQGLVTLSLTGSVIYLAVAGRPVPDLLGSATLLSLGYYFGSKSQQVITRYKGR